MNTVLATETPVERHLEHEAVLVTPVQLAAITSAFRRAKDAPMVVEKLSEMVDDIRFEDIQILASYSPHMSIVTPAFVMDVLRSAGYEESFASGEGAERFAAHVRLASETPYQYVHVPGAIEEVASLVHEHHTRIDEIIAFANANFKNPGSWTGMERETQRIVRPLVEFLHSGSPALANGSL